jgi:hypothetical protein
VRRRLARFFEDRNRQRLAAILLLQLRESQGRRHPGRSAADDEDVDLESLARHWTLTTKGTKR